MSEKKVNKSVDDTLAKLNKDFGKGTVVRLGDAPEKSDYRIISTGSLKLDIATGIGGIALGRVYEIYGWESSGKTTIATHIIAEAQKEGLLAGMIDAEHAFDTGYAKNIGVDTDNLYISQPMSAEEGLEVLDRLIKTEQFGVIVVDSVAALVPQKELDNQMGASTIGLQSRLMGQALRKIAALAQKHKVAVIFINQLREKIGVMFGTPETTSGGNALKFYASMRFDVRKTVDIENEKNATRVKIVKNKLAIPYKKAEIDIVWGKGIDRTKEVIDIAIEMGIIDKGASWFTYKEAKIQGMDKLREMLEDNPEALNEINGLVYKKLAEGWKSEEETKEDKKDGGKTV